MSRQRPDPSGDGGQRISPPDPGDETLPLILASASPRRAAFLDQLRIPYTVVPADIDETQRPGETPVNYVRRIALEKAEAVCSRRDRAVPVLAADTTVAIDAQILGKPADGADAAGMLSALAGRWHEVFTGVALVHRNAAVIGVRTRVKFRALSPASIAAYVGSGESLDKAGAYAIQGLGGAFVERIDGSYSNVVGLPLVETLELLAAAGIRHALDPAGP